MVNQPTEPSADLREAASGMWQLFERQALTIIGYALSGARGDGDQT